MRKRTAVKVAGVLAVSMLILLFGGGASGWYLVFHNRGMNLDLDPAALAASETRMWQAYYGGEGEALGLELVSLLREQFGLSYANAALVGEDMAMAAVIFAKGGLEGRAKALKRLEAAYGRLAEINEAEWDPREAAALELQWWVDRRTPGRDNPETVGASIAQLYALLYGASNGDIEAAGLLRAQAAALRDAGGRNADWPRVEALLTESYTRLIAGVRNS